jgi:hypothetical protein
MYIHEAFRLAKEMLDSHRDASGRSAFRPDGKTFSALLDGAKRIGDLARTRWILAEIVRGNDMNEDGEHIDAEVTEEVMMHVFHAYAAYKPPFKRRTAPLVYGKGLTPLGPSTESKLELQTIAEPPPDDKDNLPTYTMAPSFSHLPPQSRSEIIGEAQTLFARILEDACRDQADDGNRGSQPFSKVKLTPRLFNSYLSVHYMHAPLEDACNLFKTIFEENDVTRNMRSYVEALERCSNAKRGRERTTALAFVEELWVQWQYLEHGMPRENAGRNKARMIERANVAMIRIWTL